MNNAVNERTTRKSVTFRHVFPLEALPHRSAPRESSGVAPQPVLFSKHALDRLAQTREMDGFSRCLIPALLRGSGYRPKRFDVGNGDVRAAFARHERYARVELLCQGVDDAGS